MSARALLIVDVQNDFCEGGSLAVDGGHAVAERITDHLAATTGDYAAVIASRDWHTPGSENGGHFAPEGEQPDYVSTWPVHCVADTPGADYAPGFDTSRVTHHVKKGIGEPAYSMFEGATDAGEQVADVLGDLGVTTVEVVGIATDYCVRKTCLDATRAGFAVRLLPGLHAGVAPETSAAAIQELADAGVDTGSAR